MECWQQSSQDARVVVLYCKVAHLARPYERGHKKHLECSNDRVRHVCRNDIALGGEEIKG